MLEQVDGLRIEQMCLPFSLPLIESAGRQLIVGDLHLAEGIAVFGEGLAGDLIQAHSLNAGDGSGEVVIHHFAVETDDLHDLRTLVGLEGGDAHLGENLEQSFIDGLDIILLELIRLQVCFQSARLPQVADGRQCEVWVDGSGSEGEEAGKVMYSRSAMRN